MHVLVAHDALGFALVLLLTQRLTLVEFLLASGERDLRFDAPVFEVQAQRHNRVPLRLRLAREFLDLMGVQQQLALALGRMVVPRAVEVFGDIGAFEPDLASLVDRDERLGERGATFAQRFDFGSGQDQTRLIGVFDGIVVPCALVLRDQLDAVVLFVLLRHCLLLTQSCTEPQCTYQNLPGLYSVRYVMV